MRDRRLVRTRPANDHGTAVADSRLDPHDSRGLSVNRQRGFSLMELMVVLIITGIVLRFVVPSFAHYRLTMVENAAKAQLLEDIRAARQKAITRHTKVIVAFGN